MVQPLYTEPATQIVSDGQGPATEVSSWANRRMLPQSQRGIGQYGSSPVQNPGSADTTPPGT
jgi:hypothetical protein